MEARVSFADGGEFLDGIMTRSRGEIKRICSPKVTSTSASSTPGTGKDVRMRLCSPRVSELRGEIRSNLSPRSSSAGRGGGGQQSGEVGASNLGVSRCNSINE